MLPIIESSGVYEYMKPFLTENNKKNGGHAPSSRPHDTTFLFYAFFSCSVRNCSKMTGKGPKTVKIPLFTPGGQNMQLRGKNHKIKMFCHVLRCNLNHQRQSGLGRRPTVVGQRPTINL